MPLLLGLGGLVGCALVWVATGTLQVAPLVAFAGIAALQAWVGVSIEKPPAPSPTDLGLAAIHRAYERDEIDEDELERRIAAYLQLGEPPVSRYADQFKRRPRVVCLGCGAEVLTRAGHAPTDSDDCPACGGSVLVRSGV